MAQASKVISFEAHGGPHDAGSFVVGDRRVIVGSDTDCDFVIAEPEVAGEHASFRMINSHVEVHDLGTHSGTFVNGAKIAAPTLVGVGDEVRIGSTVLSENVKEITAGPEAAAVSATGSPAAAATTPQASAGPASPTAAPPPAAPPRGAAGMLRGPHRRRNIGIAAGVLLVAAIAVAAVLAFTGGESTLSMQQVIAKDKSSTLMVVSRSRLVSPVSGRSGIFAGSSAWVYDANRGLIVTNAHALMGGETFEAGFQGGDLTKANVVGVDAKDDLAVLHVSPGDLPGLKTIERDSGGARAGDRTFVLGYPGNSTSQTDFLRTPFQPTDGTITATGVRGNVNTDAWGEVNDNAALLLSPLYQTTAAVNAGASGGPTVNNHGKLVGTNVASGNEAQHYSIPITTIERVVPQLAQGKSIGWLGFGVSALPSHVAEAWNIEGGMVLTSVVKDTPADQAGMADYLAFAMQPPMDYLLVEYVNDHQVTTEQNYVNVVSQLQGGEQATLLVRRYSPNGHYHAYKTFKITVP